jgi:hypothetical protein
VRPSCNQPCDRRPATIAELSNGAAAACALCRALLDLQQHAAPCCACRAPVVCRNGGPAVMNWETVRPAVPTQHTGTTGGSRSSKTCTHAQPAGGHTLVLISISPRCPCTAGWRPASVSVRVSPEGGLNSANGSTSWTVELSMPWSLLQEAANRQVPPAHGEAGTQQAGQGAFRCSAHAQLVPDSRVRRITRVSSNCVAAVLPPTCLCCVALTAQVTSGASTSRACTGT